MDKYAKAVIGGITSGGSAFVASYTQHAPILVTIALTLVAFASGFGLVWAVPNAAANAVAASPRQD